MRDAYDLKNSCSLKQQVCSLCGRNREELQKAINQNNVFILINKLFNNEYSRKIALRWCNKNLKGIA